MVDGKRLDALDVVFRAIAITREGVRGREGQKIASGRRLVDSRRWVLGRFFRSFFVSVSNFVFYSIFNRFSTVSGRVSGGFWHAPGRFRECSFRRPKCLSSFDRF